jgi:2-polyprenyl-3-methyl-5-hydroxy-6-metoxy-1,4-benzoquinol methylase
MIKKIKDYSVTKQSFDIEYIEALDLYKTKFTDYDILRLYYASDKYISHTDGRSNWFEKLYQTIKKVTLKNKWNLITNQVSKKNISILDIGCGTGDFLTLGNNLYNVIGVEPNESAKAIAEKKGLQIYSTLDEVLEKKFDVITLWHVLEHVPNYDEYLIKIKSMLNNDGILIIAVPNYNSFDAKYYDNYWAAWDIPRHLWHFSKKSIQIIADKHQLKLIHIKPMYFDSFYVSLLSEEYKSGFKNIIKAGLIGLISNIKGIFTKEYSSHIYILQKAP